MSYVNKAVAFIDLLGFKEINENPDAKPTIHDLLTTNNQFVDIINTINNEHALDCEIRIFSDSVYFSYSIENIYKLIIDLKEISYKVATKGFFFRGAITVGNIYDSGKTMYGPAIIEAYNLESKIATYPRIIIDDDTFNNFIRTNKYFDKIRTRNLIAKDFDGNYFINFLSRTNTEIINPQELSEIRYYIKKLYVTNKNKPNILMKYLWLINYFNYTIEQTKKYFPKEYNPELHKIEKIKCSLKPLSIE